ncbi:MAG: cell filamentation protein Fic, partial [Blautia sp.]|nr:cell filamentation protein Fic [Blautia sp.]
WSKIDKKEYLNAMQKSVVNVSEILKLIQNALTNETESREVFMKGIDYSYYYEET